MDMYELRKKYMKALADYELAPELYKELTQLNDLTPKQYAYLATIEAIMTKTTWNPIKKIQYLNKSEEHFEKAISIDSTDIEVRFLRLSVEYEIPSYLGYSNDMGIDTKYVKANFINFNPEELPLSTRKLIIEFVNKSNRFTLAEAEYFKNHLLPNQNQYD